jgi:hypothetical protein
MSTRGIVSAIVAGGLLAATIDIGSAVLITGRSAGRILQTIAGGLLGKAAFAAGASSMLLGLALQEVMGLIIAAIYVVGTRGLPGLRHRWLSSGIAYGVVIFIVMNYVVVPLSAWHHVPHFSSSELLANLLAMLLFGLIIAFFGRRAGSGHASLRTARLS